MWYSNDGRSRALAYSTIALLNTIHSNVCIDVDCQPGHKGMPTPQVLVPRVHLQDIGVVNPCLAEQAVISLSGPSQATYQYNLATF
jgi:hypothetical protein